MAKLQQVRQAQRRRLGHTGVVVSQRRVSRRQARQIGVRCAQDDDVGRALLQIDGFGTVGDFARFGL